MSVNLLNYLDLNRFLTALVWDGIDAPNILDGKSQQKLCDISYLEQNTDSVVRMILSQYIKHRMRTYLYQNPNQPFLTPVTQKQKLPSWAAPGKMIYEFDASNVTDEMRHTLISVRDFLYAVAMDYVIKSIAHARRTKHTPRIRLDYLKTHNDFTTFESVIDSANKWHRTPHAKAKHISPMDGAEFVMHLPNDMTAYRLTTANALDFESAHMNHCVGWGGYDKKVERHKTDIYSIRDIAHTPCVTIEVKNNTITQVKGPGDNTPAQKHIHAIQKFIMTHGFDVPHERRNTGLIKRNGRYYSIFDLPDGFIVDGDLNLSDMDLAGVNLNVVVHGRLNIANAKNVTLPTHLDLSMSSDAMMAGIDFHGVKSIKWPHNSLHLPRTKNLPPVLDFSNTQIVDLNGADMTGVTEIKWPTKFISLANCTNMPKKITLSYNAYKLRINTNSKNITTIPTNNGHEIY